jgi:hypothetical protein
VTISLRGLLVFDLCIQYSSWSITKFKLDLFLFDGVRLVWDLTCDFWAENAKKIDLVDSKGNGMSCLLEIEWKSRFLHYGCEWGVPGLSTK